MRTVILMILASATVGPWLTSASAGQSSKVSPSQSRRPILKTKMHNNTLSFIPTDGTTLLSVTGATPNRYSDVHQAVIQASGFCLPQDDLIGYTSKGQAPDDDHVNRTCLKQHNVTTSGLYGRAITAGRDDSRDVVKWWKETIRIFKEPRYPNSKRPMNAATNAINTHAEVFKHDPKGLVNGFASEMNFFVVEDLTFHTVGSRGLGDVTCPGVIYGQQGTKPSQPSWSTTSVKDQGEDAGWEVVKYSKQEAEGGGPEDPVVDFLVAAEITNDVASAAGDFFKHLFLGKNTWWVAQLNTNIDHVLQGFVIPAPYFIGKAGNDSDVSELALACTNDDGKVLVVLKPDPLGKSDDYFHVRFVKPGHLRGSTTK
jgi:hypothetical protein